MLFKTKFLFFLNRNFREKKLFKTGLVSPLVLKVRIPSWLVPIDHIFLNNCQISLILCNITVKFLLTQLCCYWVYSYQWIFEKNKHFLSRNAYICFDFIVTRKIKTKEKHVWCWCKPGTIFNIRIVFIQRYHVNIGGAVCIILTHANFILVFGPRS